MVKKITIMATLCLFVLGAFSACAPPGQIKKALNPGHQMKHGKGNAKKHK